MVIHQQRSNSKLN